MEYTLNKFRAIIDASAQPIILVGQCGKEVESLDLTYSLAKSPGQTHLEYLANMGVASSASFSVVNNGKLFAMFGTHNKEPRYCSYQQLASCYALIEHYLPKFNQFLEQERQLEFQQGRTKVLKCIDALSSHGFDLEYFIKKEKKQILELLFSDDFMCCYTREKS